MEPGAKRTDPLYIEYPIVVLEPVEAIRLRPSRYIGDTTLRGLHHLVDSVVNNSVNEAAAGYGRQIRVRINADGSVTVSDEGRGIPVATVPEIDNRTAIEVLFTRIGRSVGRSACLFCINALSEWLRAEVRREGHVWAITFARGKLTEPLQKLGVAAETGTTITYKPDPQIFPDTTYDYDVLRRGLQELAFLNKGLRIQISDEVTGRSDDFYYEGGIVDFVTWLNQAKSALFPEVIAISGQGHTVIEGHTLQIFVEIALQYTDGDAEDVHAYANGAITPDGGAHVTGFRSGLTRAINTYGKKEKLFENDVPCGHDFRQGLTALVTVNHPYPQFLGSTRARLGNTEVQGIVRAIVQDQVTRYFEAHPSVARRICQKPLLAAKASGILHPAKETA